MKKRIVITGLGAVTALGEGAGALWSAALESRSGIRRLDSLGEGWRPSAGFFDAFAPEKFVTQRKSLKVMARDIQLAVAAASLALEDSGVRRAAPEPDRFGVITGSGVLNHELDELAQSVQGSLEAGAMDLKKFGEEGMRLLFPLWLLKYLPNMPACHISILFDLRGPSNTITTGSSSGLQAVGEAVRILERGAADVMLAGAAESKVNPVGLSEYKIMGVLSEMSSADPAKEYRPFDDRAHGIVVGEGAGFMVLETLDHALARGASIYAEVAGFGSASGSERAFAMQAALSDAGIPPADLDHLQASGLGILEEDRLETEAIGHVFNGTSSRLSLSASKPITGFSGFSSGPLDLILSAMTIRNGVIPPVPNLERPAAPDLRFVRTAPEKKKVRYSMTNCFGLRGQSASVILRAYDAS